MPEISLGAGIYLALTAANSIIALHCEKLAVKTDLRHAFFDSVATALGYAAVIIPVGALREMIGSSTIWGANIKVPMAFPAILMPFGGFLFLAFFAAALKALINKRFPEHSAETEMKIKKTSVIVSKKNLPEDLAPAEEEKRLPKQKRLLRRKRLSKSKRPLKPKTPKRTTWHTLSRSTARANLTFPISSPKTTKTKMTRTTARCSTACSTKQRILTPTRRRRETNEHDLVFDLLSTALYTVFIQNLVFNGGYAASEALMLAKKPRRLWMFSAMIAFFSTVTALACRALEMIPVLSTLPSALHFAMFSGVLIVVFLITGLILKLALGATEKFLGTLGMAALNTLVLATPLLNRSAAYTLPRASAPASARVSRSFSRRRSYARVCT